MKYLIPALIAVLVSACAFPTKVLSTSERTVAIQALKIDQAQAMANVECAKYGRKARWAAGDEVTWMFDCVL